MSDPGWTDLDVDLEDEHLTVRDAATTFGVTEDRIRQWKRRGHLPVSGLDVFGRPMFRGIDVLRARARAEANTRRTRLRLAT